MVENSIIIQGVHSDPCKSVVKIMAKRDDAIKKYKWVVTD